MLQWFAGIVETLVDVGLKRVRMAKVAGPVVVHLRKDLTRDIKRGHVWIYGDAIDRPQAASGSVAVLVDRSGQKVASGIYDPRHAIPLRICRTTPPWDLNASWFERQMLQAIELRRIGLPAQTTGYRLINGEGDGLPGLVVDVYGDTAVIKLDGGAPQSFYDIPQIARWLVANANVSCVVNRPRERGQIGQTIEGPAPRESVPFEENGLKFTADVIRGQKTGFFLDQRDNRALIRGLARDRTVLNLFSFSGGFSIAAGVGGCAHATSVDLAPAAIEDAQRHWQMNDLCQDRHTGVVSDVFEYLEQVGNKRSWDIVICDPPSFAPSERTRRAAEEAYQRLATLCARIVSPGGLLALASCSSHIDAETFAEVNLGGIGRARRVATVLALRSLPCDHPTPMAMPELRYLKFQLVRL